MAKGIILILSVLFSLTSISAQGIDPILVVPNLASIRGLSLGKTGVTEVSSNALFTNPALLAKLNSVNTIAATRVAFGMVKNQYMEELAKENDGEYTSNNLPPTVNLAHLTLGVPLKLHSAAIPIEIGFGLGYRPTYDWTTNSITIVSNETPLGNIEQTVTSKYRGGQQDS